MNKPAIINISPPTTPVGESADVFGAILLSGLIAGLAWAPLWLGGNRPLAWGVNGIVFPALALLHEGAVLLGRRRHSVALQHIAVPVGLFLAVLMWGLVQVSPAPKFIAHPIWSIAGDALARPLSGSISVNPVETGLALLRLVTDASVFWISLQLCRTPSRANLLLWAIAAIASLYAVVGFILSAGFDNAIPLIDAPPPQDGMRATFVNRNHFATYAGIGLVVSVGLSLKQFGHHAIDDWRSVARRVLRATTPIAFAAVTLGALLASASRGGVAATAVAIAALLALLAPRLKAGPTSGWVGVLFALALGFVFFSDAFLTRVSSVGLDGAARAGAYRLVIGSIFNNPITGMGYGAFIDAFPLYRDQSIPTEGLWDKAHNSYLEAFHGLGIVFGAALIAAVALLALKCLRGARRRHRNVTPSVVAAAASVLVGVHALVDFSLQIEAVALTYMALLGAGVAQSESSRLVLGD